MTEIGQKIAEERKRAGLTQQELAEKVGYKTKSAINKIELGVTDLPRKKVAAFARALEVSPGHLMGWDDEPKNNDVLSDIIVRLRTDDEFLYVVQALYKMEPEKLRNLSALL